MYVVFTVYWQWGSNKGVPGAMGTRRMNEWREGGRERDLNLGKLTL